MKAATRFLCASLALHVATLGLVVSTGSGVELFPRTAAREAEPLLVEDATLEAADLEATRGRELGVHAEEQPEALLPPTASRKAALAPARARTPTGTGSLERSPGRRHGSRSERSPTCGDDHDDACSGTVAGAPRTVFGTAVLRSFLLALSADPSAARGSDHRTWLRYEGGDGAAPQVRAEPDDAASLRMARALEALLAHASSALPRVAGTLVVDTEHDERADGVFRITCDDARQTGTVEFADGRRARVRELH